MSLPEAVTAIIERIEAEANEMDGGQYIHGLISRRTMRAFANELRVALEASKGTTSSSPSINYNVAEAMAQHRSMIDEARRKIREEKGLPPETAMNLEESMSPRYLQAVGGKSDGCMIPIDPNFRVGAETAPIDGDIYVLGEDSLLHFVREHLTITPAK